MGTRRLNRDQPPQMVFLAGRRVAAADTAHARSAPRLQPGSGVPADARSDRANPRLQRIHAPAGAAFPCPEAVDHAALLRPRRHATPHRKPRCHGRSVCRLGRRRPRFRTDGAGAIFDGLLPVSPGFPRHHTGRSGSGRAHRRTEHTSNGRDQPDRQSVRVAHSTERPDDHSCRPREPAHPGLRRRDCLAAHSRSGGGPFRGAHGLTTPGRKGSRRYDGKVNLSPAERLGVILVAIATPCVIVGLSVLVFLNPIWVGFEQDRSNVDRLTGYTSAQVHEVTGSILSDLVFGPANFAVTVDGAPVLDARERGHMVDVRTVMGELGFVAVLAAVMLVALGLYSRGRRWFWWAARFAAREDRK